MSGREFWCLRISAFGFMDVLVSVCLAIWIFVCLDACQSGYLDKCMYVCLFAWNFFWISVFWRYLCLSGCLNVSVWLDVSYFLDVLMSIFFRFLDVVMSNWMPVWLSGCVHVCLSAADCLYVRKIWCLDDFLPVYLDLRMFGCISGCLSYWLSLCISGCLPVCLTITQSVWQSGYLSWCLYLMMSDGLTGCLSFQMYVCLPVSTFYVLLDVYLSSCLSEYLFWCQLFCLLGCIRLATWLSGCFDLWMSRFLSVYCVWIFVCLDFCLDVYVDIWISVWMSFLMFVCWFLSVCMSWCEYVNLSGGLYFFWYRCLPVWIYVCLSEFLSRCSDVCLDMYVWMSMDECLNVSVDVCLDVCSDVCSDVWMQVCLVCLCVSLYGWVSGCMFGCLSVWVSFCLFGCLSVWITVTLDGFMYGRWSGCFLCDWMSNSLSVLLSGCVDFMSASGLLSLWMSVWMAIRELFVCLDGYLYVCLSVCSTV